MCLEFRPEQFSTDLEHIFDISVDSG